MPILRSTPCSLPKDPIKILKASVAFAFGLQLKAFGYLGYFWMQLGPVKVTLFSAPNYCGEFDNAGAMMTLDEPLGQCLLYERYE